MFILFDLVIHNPAHPETELNLSLLDVAAGYFGRFDYATNGAVPAALLSGFAHIANQFVKETRDETRSPTSNTATEAAGAPVSPDSLPDKAQQLRAFLSLGAGMLSHSRDYLKRLMLTFPFVGPEALRTMTIDEEQHISASVDPPLSYPSTMTLDGIDPLMDEELLAGFDFTNLFGYVMPESHSTGTLRDYLLS
jgi:hypothetical protein